MAAQTRTRLSRKAWVEAALEATAEGGLAAVAVVPLAKRLGATKGSFYWHFANREALVEAALAAWEHSHTAAVIAEIEASSDDPLQQLRLLFRRVTELAARDRIELALLATADHSTVQPVLDRVTRRRSTSPPSSSSGSASRAPRRSDERSSPTAPTSGTHNSSTPRRTCCRKPRQPSAPTSTTFSSR